MGGHGERRSGERGAGLDKGQRSAIGTGRAGCARGWNWGVTAECAQRTDCRKKNKQKLRSQNSADSHSFVSQFSL